MQTLNLASVPATDNQAASIIVMDDKNNIFCTIYADGKIKVIGEDAELIAPEMAQINLVQQNFDLFFKNVYDKKLTEDIEAELDDGLNTLKELLSDLRQYMDVRADADCIDEVMKPNKEMVFLNRIDEVVNLKR